MPLCIQKEHLTLHQKATHNEPSQLYTKFKNDKIILCKINTI